MKQRASKLDAHADDLAEWFEVERATLDTAIERLARRGVAVSKGRLSEWWADEQARRAQARILADITSGAKDCKAIEAEFDKNPAPGVEVIVKLLRVVIMQLAVRGKSNPDALDAAKGLLKMVLQHESQQFEREKFREAIKDNVEVALDSFAEVIKKNPKLRAAYDAFRAEVNAAFKEAKA